MVGRSTGSKSADVVIIGAGIVGLATATELQSRDPSLSVSLVEAEDRVAVHQSGHNSGVVHSGIYYKPGSHKALTCRSGKKLLTAFCEEENIPLDRCGKVVVATCEKEITSLDKIARRATQNGVEYERIDSDQLRKLEPAVAGIAGLHVPETGIVDYATVCRAMQKRIIARGGIVRLGFRVDQIDCADGSIAIKSELGATVECRQFINCAGLQSDRILKLAGKTPQVKIVPFRGEYYELESQSESLVRNLIYPVPDPAFPFLGVHFTRMIGGGVECGPNAVLALSRHGYDWRSINAKDLVETLSYAGFRKLALSNWRMGLGEIHRSLSKRAFVRALQKLVPAITINDLKQRRSGVRAQAVAADGTLVDDFLIEETAGAIHVLNAPSPAATASLAIAKQIVDRFFLLSGQTG
ncbi:L-2-hydroxyglutarate oxidase LhgO [Novipirellula aureliae]|uniref:L-2-hydroxyglutarate oxidase LhgO n=1 Tax=Novipirellula aureliae TaxID=2527966 RepID=A0A5C6DXE0_9BACT|nr:L-2-hydroxyglutarate oxidase [Novipirellula aureliae]TWU41400.1 L-2-hydroxyglutarate oxidase LhgO [Novipirellula aureliae]